MQKHLAKGKRKRDWTTIAIAQLHSCLADAWIRQDTIQDSAHEWLWLSKICLFANLLTTKFAASWVSLTSSFSSSTCRIPPHRHFSPISLFAMHREHGTPRTQIGLCAYNIFMLINCTSFNSKITKCFGKQSIPRQSSGLGFFFLKLRKLGKFCFWNETLPA